MVEIGASRPRCSVFIAVSLDGFIARSDGSIDWLSKVEVPGEDYGYQRFFASVDALIVGRNTYDTVLGFPDWPYLGKRCLVLTGRPAPAPRADEEFFAGTPSAALAHLQRAGVSHVYVDGGAVISSFLKARLIDEMTVSLIPILLGGGVRLFPGGEPEQATELLESRAFPSGLVQLRYRLSS